MPLHATTLVMLRGALPVVWLVHAACYWRCWGEEPRNRAKVDPVDKLNSSFSNSRSLEIQSFAFPFQRVKTHYLRRCHVVNFTFFSWPHCCCDKLISEGRNRILFHFFKRGPNHEHGWQEMKEKAEPQ